MPRPKPSIGVPVRKSHPLAAGLVRSWIFNARRGRDTSSWNFRDSCAGDNFFYTRNNADTFWTDGPAGSAFQCGADGGTAYPISTSTLSQMGSGLTTSSISVVGRYQKFGSNPNLEAAGADASGASSLLASRDTSGDTGFFLYSTASAVRWVVNGPGLAVGASFSDTISSGVWYTFGGSYRRDPNVATFYGYWDLYTAGQFRGQNNYNVAGSYAGTLSDNVVGAGYVNVCSDKRIDFLNVWNRALTATEHAWINDDPFDMYVPRRSWWMGASVAAGGGTGVTAAKLAGQSARLTGRGGLAA